MMQLGIDLNSFFESEHCFNVSFSIVPELSNLAETLSGQNPTEQYSPYFSVKKSRSTTNRFSNPWPCRPSFRPKDGSFEDHWYTLDELDNTP